MEQLNTAIDALLEEHDEAAIFKMVLDRKRKNNHTKAKADQPKISIAFDEPTWSTVEAFARRPIGKEEEGQGGLDHLTVTVMDCIAAKDADDLLFALLRVLRKVHHLQPHLGPIEGAVCIGPSQV